MKTMPWVYATEYVCDMLSASYTYNPKDFKPETTLEYFETRKDHYFMTTATKEYITWCLTEYKDNGFKNLKKANTKKKYQEIINKYPDVELFETEKATEKIPELKK